MVTSVQNGRLNVTQEQTLGKRLAHIQKLVDLILADFSIRETEILLRHPEDGEVCLVIGKDGYFYRLRIGNRRKVRLNAITVILNFGYLNVAKALEQLLYSKKKDRTKSAYQIVAEVLGEDPRYFM